MNYIDVENRAIALLRNQLNSELLLRVSRFSDHKKKLEEKGWVFLSYPSGRWLGLSFHAQTLPQVANGCWQTAKWSSILEYLTTGILDPDDYLVVEL